METGTDATRLLRIALPILGAPQPDLAAGLAFSTAGGLGVLAPGAAWEHVPGGPGFAVQLDDAAPGRDLPPIVIGPLGRLPPGGIRICLVGGLAEAEQAGDAGMECLLLAGPAGLPDLDLVLSIRRLWPDLPLIVAGVSDGYGMAAALACGAGAVQVTPGIAAAEIAGLADDAAARAPAATRPALAARTARHLREAEALRANLRRRKMQSRSRPDPAVDGEA